MGGALKAKVVVLLVCGIFACVGPWLYGKLQRELTPAEDRGLFRVILNFPLGSTPEYAESYSKSKSLELILIELYSFPSGRMSPSVAPAAFPTILTGTFATAIPTPTVALAAPTAIPKHELSERQSASAAINFSAEKRITARGKAFEFDFITRVASSRC